MSVFNILPLIIELTFVLVIIFVLYPVIFFTITGVSIVLYITATVTITEWRAKYFKRLAQKDTEYSQKATDSLLNFETVKYFNAEEHEEGRFIKALQSYKRENILVARSLAVLNVIQSFVIAVGLVISLLVAYKKIIEPDEDRFNVGDFIMINTYILQLYAPLNFLGTMWRFIR
jgi:ABC-type transport system involved in Fe-S cluster assembly fused permease/ATPase subunit